MTYPEIQAAIAVASLEPSRQSLDHILDIMGSINEEVHRLRLEVARLKLRDAPFKQFGVAGRYQGRGGSTAKSRNGVNSPTSESKGESVKSIRGQRVAERATRLTRPVKAVGE